MDEADRRCLVELKDKYKLGLVTNFAYPRSIPRLFQRARRGEACLAPTVMSLRGRAVGFNRSGL